MPAEVACLRLMGHELRTPLNAIIGFSDILGQGLAGPVTPEQECQLKMIGGAGRQLLALINDMMELARAQAGALELATQEADSLRLLKDSTANAILLAEERGVHVVVTDSVDAPHLVTDLPRARRTLECILIAAVRACSDCTLRLSVGPGKEAGLAEFRIDGLCEGAQGEVISDLFDAQTVEGAEPSQPTDGVELGLCLARAYAEALGGSISTRSHSADSFDAVVFSLPTRLSAD